MCGGVGYQLKNIPKKELQKYFDNEMIGKLEKKGRIESFFWYKDPILPIDSKKGILVC